MPLKLFIALSLFLFAFCSSRTEAGNEISPRKNRQTTDTIRPPAIDSSRIDSISLKINFTPGTDYNAVKLGTVKLKSKIKVSADSIKKQELENLVLNQIIPYWYGTPWDFSGYTDVPNKGVIACGYFVSTVMKHAGFNVNRYKLAQQDPLNEAKTVAAGDSVEVFEVNAFELQRIFRNEKEEGLYFVGLDFHVGFLLFRNRELYFIHSNYINSEGVKIEKALYSDAFNAAQKYRVAAFSTNRNLIEKWISGTEIKVVMN